MDTPINLAETKESQFTGLTSSGIQIMDSVTKEASSCVTESIPPDSSDHPHDRPGYRLMPYVADFLKTDSGDIPIIQTHLTAKDHFATALVRCGINRYQYKVVPGLYAVGHPNKEAEVLVTANYKLTFDHLRKELEGLDAWILVLDTKGINVWCAAGKGTFATPELVSRIQKVGLKNLVNHKRLIVPQLGATGVSAQSVKKLSGFRVIYGPVRACDIRDFLSNKYQADHQMRTVTFTFGERLILAPVEIQITLKPALIIAMVLFLISGIGAEGYSLVNAWNRGGTAFAALLVGILSGAVLTPALLPYIPVRAFALKGIAVGLLASLLFVSLVPGARTSFTAGCALFLFLIMVSSFLAMNFTGTTPFTSPSGVEKEMKQYLPIQMAGLVLAAGLWMYSAF